MYTRLFYIIEILCKNLVMFVFVFVFGKNKNIVIIDIQCYT